MNYWPIDLPSIHYSSADKLCTIDMRYKKIAFFNNMLSKRFWIIYISIPNLLSVKYTTRQGLYSGDWYSNCIFVLFNICPISNILAYIPQLNILAFHRLESLVEFRLERIIGKLRDALELRRQPVRLAQFLLQPRYNLALDGERRERKLKSLYPISFTSGHLCPTDILHRIVKETILRKYTIKIFRGKVIPQTPKDNDIT